MGISYNCPSGRVLAAGKTYTPSWAPSAGEIKTISYAAGTHPLGSLAGAVLSEIDPVHQSWNPAAPGVGPYGGTSGNYFFSSINSYGGACFNTDSRQIVCYGAGHVAFNVPAPFAFDLNDLRWKWLDAPLPIDGLDLLRAAGVGIPANQATVQIYYPSTQYDYNWGDWNGDWPGWPAGYERPGKIQPNPGHSRARLQHIPASAFGNTKGALFWNASGTGVLTGVNAYSSHLFDYDAASWARANQQIPTSAPGSSGGSIYDAVSKKVILAGNIGGSNSVWVFDTAAKTWATRTGTNALTTGVDHGGNVNHLASGLCIAPCSRNSGGTASAGADGITYQFWACSIAAIAGAGSFGWSQLTVALGAGATWPLNASGNNDFIGWSYCPADGCLYTVNGVNGSSNYWRLKPPAGAVSQSDYLSGTWTLDKLTFSSGSLSSPGTKSFVFNRLSWDSKSRSFIWFPDSINGPVQAFRPAGVA